MCNLKSGHFLQNKIGIYEYIIGFLGGIYKVLWAEKIDIIDTFRWIFLVIFKKMLVRAERLYTWNLKIGSKIFIFESLRKVESSGKVENGEKMGTYVLCKEGGNV